MDLSLLLRSTLGGMSKVLGDCGFNLVIHSSSEKKTTKQIHWHIEVYPEALQLGRAGARHWGLRERGLSGGGRRAARRGEQEGARPDGRDYLDLFSSSMRPISKGSTPLSIAA